jgi:hypothetical protein
MRWRHVVAQLGEPPKTPGEYSTIERQSKCVVLAKRDGGKHGLGIRFNRR